MRMSLFSTLVKPGVCIIIITSVCSVPRHWSLFRGGKYPLLWSIQGGGHVAKYLNYPCIIEYYNNGQN